MGRFQALCWKEQLGCKEGFEMHLRTNFYPQLPEYVINESVEAMQDFHDGKIGYETLAERCYLRSVEALENVHDVFMFDKDIE